MMSQPASNTSLSTSARLLCYLGPPSVILLTSFASLRTGLLSPIAFLPSVVFFSKWRADNKIDGSRRGELEPLIWTYATIGTIGLAAAATVQMALCLAGSRFLFGTGELNAQFWTELKRSTVTGLTADEVTRRAALAGSWQNWVFNGVFSFLAAGCIEETLKYMPILYARRRNTIKGAKPRNRAYLDYALVGSLSFSVVESIGFLYTSSVNGKETGPKLLLTVVERVLFGSLGHALVASLTALRAIRRDCYGEQLSWWAVIGPAAALHGMFDFFALSFSAIEGNVGWIHPTDTKNTTAMFGAIGGVISTAAWLVWRDWKLIDKQDQKQQ